MKGRWSWFCSYTECLREQWSSASRITHSDGELVNQWLFDKNILQCHVSGVKENLFYVQGLSHACISLIPIWTSTLPG